MAEKARMMARKTMGGIILGCKEFFNLFGIAAFAVFMSWGAYYALATASIVPNFEISLEGFCWATFIEFIAIMVTVFAVRIADGYYDKN